MGANDQDDVPEKLRGWELTPTLQPAFDYVAGYESRGRPNIMNGGKETFDTSGTHPNRVGAGGTSRAAGYTQWMPKTWADVAGADTVMSPDYQKRAFAKYSVNGYRDRTGRDLEADIAEAGGITPQIAQVLDAVQLGIKSTNGYVLGNVPGGKRASQDQIMGTYKGAKMADNQSDAGSDQIQYGGGQQGPYSKSSRMEEYNIPFQQRAEKAGLLGMLGVQTTPGERMALMKMGATMMTTVGNPLTALGEGIGAYVNETKAQNKAQSDLAGAQQEAKLREAQARQAVSASNKDVLNTAEGMISTGANWRGNPTTSTTTVAEPDTTKDIGGGGQSGSSKVGNVSVAPSGKIEIDPSVSSKLTPEMVTDPSKAAPELKSVAQKIKEGFDLGNIYTGEGNTKTEDKAEKLRQLVAETNYKTPTERMYNYADDRKKFLELQNEKEAAFKAMQANQTNLNTYAKAMPYLPTTGGMTTGAGAEKRYNIADTIVTGLNALGVSDDDLRKAKMPNSDKSVYDYIKESKDALAARTELNKVSTALARMQNPSGTTAVRWLETSANSLPDVANQSKANSVLLGNMYAERVRAKDDYNVVNAIGDLTKKAGNASKASGILQKMNDAKDYSKIADVTSKMLDPANEEFMYTDKNGDKYNLVSLYLAGRISDKKFNSEAAKHFGIYNASRIFD